MPDLATRFNLYVATRPDESSACWNWVGAIDGKGYGRIWDGVRMRLSHRISWMLYVGEIPIGVHCLHRCDNPRCVRPGHLFLGSRADNMSDMMKKGRGGHWKLEGEKSPNAKLTEDQVRHIISISPLNRGQPQLLAAKYGVHPETIARISKGLGWRHLWISEQEQGS